MNCKINSHFKLLVLTSITVLLSACSNPDIPTNSTDSDGLVRYAMPDGWTNTEISGGDHYMRADIEDSPMLAVVARERVQREASPTILQVQESTKGKHEVQKHTLIEESTRTRNGFTVWEAIYEARPKGKDVIYHDVFLFTDALQVEVSLNAYPQDHKTFEADLRTVVESVQANTAD
jgi:hypothetical protein